MKTLSILLLLLPFGLFAQESDDSSNEQVIVIERDLGNRVPNAPQAFVESGDDVILGSPEENVKAAYRKWQEACELWKKELKSNNRQNLMIASCGSPKRRTEKLELSTLHTFESKATYKIKVNCN